jgi:DNA-binding NarL/FixJ family response regulator
MANTSSIETNAISPPEASIRILIVDDFEPFRVFVFSVFSNAPEFQIICEASDGLEAVQKAEELKPDLILLDIGLPRLNGIQAARQIRKLAPSSKILFLSQESSADVVQEALDLGAMGYVVKAYAGSELLAAVEAVCQGRRFVSVGSSGGNITRGTNSQPLDCLSGKEIAAPVAPFVL